MPQPFAVEDLFLHRRVMELAVAPDGRSLVCALRSIDREQDDYVSRLWRLPLDGGRPRQLTHGPGLDQSPRWSPDGRRLAFLSDRGGSAQVHLLAVDGGEAAPLGELPGAVSELRWRPDGEALVVSAAVTVDPDWRGERAQGRAPVQRKVQPQLAWKLPYKTDGVGYLLGREIHLFQLDARTGEHRQLTDGPFDVLAFDLAPDGRRFACARTRSGRFAHRTDLWLYAAAGSEPRQLTRDFATVASLRWSRDADAIVFCATGAEGDAQTGVYLLDLAAGAVRRLGGAELEVADPESLDWDADGRGVLLVAQRRGRHALVRVPLSGADAEVLLACEGQVGSFGRAGATLCFSADHPVQASEVQAWDAAAGLRPLSDFNPWWKEREPIRVERRSFEVPDGRGGSERIEGWLLRAEGRSGPQPLLDDVHGGPASHVLLDFDTNVYWQVLCARGWAVLALDPVGSASYGREFRDRLAGHWGEYDLPQHLAALAQLRAEGVCDERVAIAGKSYGGYLAAWAIGHCDLFRAAVVMAPVGNIEAHYGTSDGGYYADPFYLGAEEFDRERARALSPLAHVHRATTPTLFLQGADDQRCPRSQSEELFVTLMRAGTTPTELVLYPGEDHHFLGEGAPAVREDAARRIIAWLERHVGGA